MRLSHQMRLAGKLLISAGKVIIDPLLFNSCGLVVSSPALIPKDVLLVTQVSYLPLRGHRSIQFKAVLTPSVRRPHYK